MERPTAESVHEQHYRTLRITRIHFEGSSECTSARDLATGCQMGYYDRGALDWGKKEWASRCTITLSWRKANRFVLSLVEPLSYDDPPAFYLSSTPGSAIDKRLAWYRLARDTWKDYAAAINSYVSFCPAHNEKPQQAQTVMLESWQWLLSSETHYPSKAG